MGRRRDVGKKRLRLKHRQRKRCRAITQIPDESDERIQRFLEWCDEVGIFLHKSVSRWAGLIILTNTHSLSHSAVHRARRFLCRHRCGV